MPKLPVKKPTLTKPSGLDDGGITAPYDSSLCWAIYDMERSNETLAGAQESLGDRLNDVVEKLGALESSMDGLAKKIESLTDLLKERLTG